MITARYDLTYQLKRNSMDKKPRTPHSLRLPVDLQKWLKHQAVDNGHSLTAEIVQRLDQSQRQQLEKEAVNAT